MATTDSEGRVRRGLYLPPVAWAWLETTADDDGTSRNDLLEGLVLLAMDEPEGGRVAAQPGTGLGLAQLRVGRGLNQTAVANAMGTTQSGVSRIERQNDLKVSTLCAYAEATGGELVLAVSYPDGEAVRVGQRRILTDH